MLLLADFKEITKKYVSLFCINTLGIKHQWINYYANVLIKHNQIIRNFILELHFTLDPVLNVRTTQLI